MYRDINEGVIGTLTLKGTFRLAAITVSSALEEITYRQAELEALDTMLLKGRDSYVVRLSLPG